MALASWNGRRFVEEQLRSIARQTRVPDELVVSDDASTDGTPELVERVCSEQGLPLRLLRGTTRCGVAGTFERAVSATNGDVVVLCDQDDVWAPNKLALTQREFDRRPSLGGVFSDGRIIDEQGRPTGRTLWMAFGFGAGERRRTARGGIRGVLLRKNVVTGATLAFAGHLRDLVLPIGRSGLHDRWIALLVAAAADLEPMPQRLIDYRIHPHNVEGLGVRTSAAAIAQRGTGRQFLELEHFEAVLRRLRERMPEGARTIPLLEEKVRHLRVRCDLPRGSPRRAIRIAAALPAYARFSSGWRSPLLDLVAPTRASASGPAQHTPEGTSDDARVD